MLYRVLLAAGLGLALSATPAVAQNRFAVDLNVGGAFPTTEFGGSDLDPGLGLGFAGNVRVMPHAFVYAGWDYHRFVTKQAILGSDFDVDDTGYAFGARFQHPILARVDVWVRGGGIYNHVELEDENGNIVADSGHELGWEGGGGFGFNVTDRFAIMPGARFRTYSADVTLGQTTLPVELTYITAEVMLSWKFGGPILSARR
jgi:hypothetical protein